MLSKKITSDSELTITWNAESGLLVICIQEASCGYKSCKRECKLTPMDLGHFDEAIDYIERYDLYVPALRLWSNQPEESKVSKTCKNRVFIVCHADYLIYRQSTSSTASIYSSNDDIPRQPNVSITLG